MDVSVDGSFGSVVESSVVDYTVSKPLLIFSSVVNGSVDGSLSSVVESSVVSCIV